jgi:hypothetical protein
MLPVLVTTLTVAVGRSQAKVSVGFLDLAIRSTGFRLA